MSPKCDIVAPSCRRAHDWTPRLASGSQAGSTTTCRASAGVVVTPNLSNRVDTPRVAASLAKGAARQNERGNGDAWTWSSGPVVAAWPTERTLQRCVPMAIDQTLIVLDWNSRPPFDGWAAATGAYNAATDENTPLLDRALHDEFVGMSQWDRELVGSARTGRDRGLPQAHLRALHAAGLDEDFVVTYAIALGYTGDLTTAGALPCRHTITGAVGMDELRHHADTLPSYE